MELVDLPDMVFYTGFDGHEWYNCEKEVAASTISSEGAASVP
jgi:hypothetical protein